MGRPAIAAVLAAVLLAGELRADLAIRPVTSDFDAEFARAADLLEQGQREEAEAVLAEIRRRANQRAWDVRVALLLAADDERRGELASAERRLATTYAAAIGIEPYRLDQLGRVLDASGRTAEAVREWRRALDGEEPFARRVPVGRALARALEKLGRRADALLVLSRIAPLAAGRDLVAIEVDRIRLGLATAKPAVVNEAARSLLLRSPSADVARSTPVATRSLLRRVEPRLSAADRAWRGRALVEAGDAKRGLRLLSERPAAWPPADRAANQLALARALASVGRAGAAEAAAARVPRGAPEWYAARVFSADLVLSRIGKGQSRDVVARSPRVVSVRRMLAEAASSSAPPAVRHSAREKLVRLFADANDFDAALFHARELAREVRGTVRGFEPLWELAWKRWRAGDFPGAHRGFETLEDVYDDVWRDRRTSYWRARALEKEGRRLEARQIYARLAGGRPTDLYALWSRSRAGGHAAPAAASAGTGETGVDAAEFRRVDELLRLRLFAEASAEARALSPSRGRDLRVAEADFALGRFQSAAAAAKRAFREIGTAEEARVPDGWRRLHYPVEDGGSLTETAREFRLDVAVLRGLIRQESVFDAGARSRAGALGLTQLMPGTAEPLVRSVLRVRYRRAFLYDPDVNARLGAAYLRQLRDRFGGNLRYALAAYNGGPSRMASVLRENRGRPEDEILESLPFHETRDYVRRVLLYAESYRELYPGK